MRPSRCNFKSALGLNLTTHLTQIKGMLHGLRSSGLYFLPALFCLCIDSITIRVMRDELPHHVEQMHGAEDFDGRYKGGLLRAFGRQHQTHAAMLALQG